MRALLVAAAMLAVSAPAASADTQYGGSAIVKGSLAAPYLGFVRHDDGRISARATVPYQCRKYRNSNLIVRLRGATADGVNFTATGTTRIGALGRLRVTLTGTLAPDAVSGKAKVNLRGCPGYTRSLSLRGESAPAGVPAVPPAKTVFNGLSSQAAAGVRMPVTLRVAANGRVYATWTATMKCGPKAVLSMGSSMPPTTIKPDGTFLDDKPYTIRYSDGSSDRFRIRFEGRFLADGVVGTLRARMQTRKKGKRYYPCDSGTQTWAARP
jgi:hypothetical protein